MSKKKTVTVNQLHKMLGKFIEKGEGRRPVCVNKDTFGHNCEADGVVILSVEDCQLRSVLWWNNDTDDCLNKDGSERYRKVALMLGDHLAGDT
jgi:hypothetical protein